jgi:hypothetical protein
LTLAAGVSVAAVALVRHFAQTDADRQRRITESFSKAVEQLASDKLEVRLGGIYTLERISRESLGDYWTVMEMLCAFVRERALWRKPDTGETLSSSKSDLTRPSTDIAAVLDVIGRRLEVGRTHEKAKGLKVNLRKIDLRRASLSGANLTGAFLFGANLRGAHLSDADLTWAHLSGADLSKAHLEGALLFETDLRDANLGEAHLYNADLSKAHLAGADLRTTQGLSETQLAKARGNASTLLPEGMVRPTNWLGPDADGWDYRPPKL